MREANLRETTKIGWYEKDLTFQGQSIFKLALGSLGGGLASAVGLGGGIVFNPVLIGLNMPPQVAAATGMYMIMFSSFLNSLTFYLFDMLKLDYAFWVGFWSSLGIAFFLFFIGKLIKKYNRPSVIVIILAFVIALCAIVVPIVNIQHLISQSELGFDIWAFGNLC